MLRKTTLKIPLVLLICLFFISGCTAITDFLQEDMRGPSWDTNVRLPLIPTHEIKLLDIIGENENEFDGDEIFSFTFELDRFDFGLDEIELEDIDFGSVETTLPGFEVDFGEVFSGEVDPFGLQEGQDITLDAEIPTLDLSSKFTNITIENGSLDFHLTVDDPEDMNLAFNVKIILLDNGNEIVTAEEEFNSGEAQVPISLAGIELPSEVDVVFEITEPSDDYTGKLLYSAEMNNIKIEKVTDLQQEINIVDSTTVILDAEEFDENIKEVIMEEGYLNLTPNIPDNWNIDFSIEGISISGQNLPRVDEGVFSIEGVPFYLEDDIEVGVDFQFEGSNVTYDATESVDFSCSLTDLQWREITVTGLLTDVEDIKIDEEVFETGLDELKDWLKGIGLAEEAITLTLQVENETGFEISSDLALILLYTFNDTEEKSKIEADEFHVAPRETKEILFSSGEIPSMPHSIKIPESILHVSVPQGEEVTISRSDFISAVGEADFKLKFLVQPGGIKNDVVSGKLQLDTEDRDILRGWVQNILIDFYNINNLPLYLDLTVFFSNDEDNIFDPANPNWTIGLPETGTGENYLVEISKEDLELFQKPAWYGIRVEILKDIKEPTEINFKYGDSFSTRANLDVEIRVNPHED